MAQNGRADILFLALTRPALTLGVPLEGLIVNSAACLIGGMFLSSHDWRNSPFMYWLAFIPIHMAMRRLTAWDYHFFRTIRLWFMTTGVGISALSIVATQRVRTGRGVSSSG